MMKRLLAFFLPCALALPATAQTESLRLGFPCGGTVVETPAPRQVLLKYLKQCLDDWQQCRTGALTERGAGVTVRGSNASAWTGIPKDMAARLTEINQERGTVADVNLTEQGAWLVVYGKNGYDTAGCTASFSGKMQELNARGETIRSACFNDQGHWAIVTKEEWYANADGLKALLEKAERQYGLPYNVFLTERGAVVCCENGVLYKDIPSGLAQVLRELPFTPRVVKFTDGGRYLVTDGVKRCLYRL